MKGITLEDELAQLTSALTSLETNASEGAAAEDYLHAAEEQRDLAEAVFGQLHAQRHQMSGSQLECFAALSHRYFEKMLLNGNWTRAQRIQRVDNWLIQYAQVGESVRQCLPMKIWADFCQQASAILFTKGYYQPEIIPPISTEPQSESSETLTAQPLDPACQTYYREVYRRLSMHLVGSMAITSDRVAEAADLIDIGITVGASFIPKGGAIIGGIMRGARVIAKHREAAEISKWADSLPEIDNLARYLALSMTNLRREQLPLLKADDFSQLKLTQLKWLAQEFKEHTTYAPSHKLALHDVDVMLDLLLNCMQSEASEPEARVAENTAALQQAFQQSLTTTDENRTLSLWKRLKKKERVFLSEVKASKPSASTTDSKTAKLPPAHHFNLTFDTIKANAWRYHQAGLATAIALGDMDAQQNWHARLKKLQEQGNLQQRADYQAAHCLAQLTKLTASTPPAWQDVLTLFTDVCAYMKLPDQTVEQHHLWKKLHTVWSASKDTTDISQQALQQHLTDVTTAAACQTLHTQMMQLLDGLIQLDQPAIAKEQSRRYQESANHAFQKELELHNRLEQKIAQATQQAEQYRVRQKAWNQVLQRWEQQIASILKSPEAESSSTDPQRFIGILKKAWIQGQEVSLLEQYCSIQYESWRKQHRQNLPSANEHLQTLQAGITQLKLIINSEVMTASTPQDLAQLATAKELCKTWKNVSGEAVQYFLKFSTDTALETSSVLRSTRPTTASADLIKHLESELGQPPCGFALLHASIVLSDTVKHHHCATYTRPAEPHIVILITDSAQQDNPYWQAYAKLWQWQSQYQNPTHTLAEVMHVWVSSPSQLPSHVLLAKNEGSSQANATSAVRLMSQYETARLAHLQSASEGAPFTRSYGYHGLQALFKKPLPDPLPIDSLLAPLRDFTLQLGLYHGIAAGSLVSSSAILDALAEQKRLSTTFITDLRAALSLGEAKESVSPKELEQHYQHTVEALWHSCGITADRQSRWSLTQETTTEFDPLWAWFEDTLSAFKQGLIPLDQQQVNKHLDFLVQVITHRQQFTWSEHRRYLLTDLPDGRYLHDSPDSLRLQYLNKLKQALPEQKSLITRLYHAPTATGQRLAREEEHLLWEKELKMLWQESTSDHDSKSIFVVRTRQDYTTREWRLENKILHPDIARQLFKSNGQWRDKDPKYGGNHRVYPIIFPDETVPRFWVKVYPEQPAAEYLVTELDRRLGVEGTPYFELVRFSHGQESAAVIVSAVNGTDLQYITEKEPEQLSQLSFTAFAGTLLRVLLTNPEDDKQADYFLVPQPGETSQRLMRIDNERAFFKPSSAGQRLLFKSEHLLVKSVLYCLEQMRWMWSDFPDVVPLVEDLLSLDPVALISELLQKTDELHDGWNQLFTPPVVHQHFICKDPWASLPVMCIPNGLAKELITRLTLMQNALRRIDNRQISGLHLLEVTQPKLSQYYKAGHRPDSKTAKSSDLVSVDHSQVKSRFKQIAGHLYKQQNPKDALSPLKSGVPHSVAMQSSLRLESPIGIDTLEQIIKKETCSAKCELAEFTRWQESQHRHFLEDILGQKATAAAEWGDMPLRQQNQLFEQLQAKALAQQLSREQKIFILQTMVFVLNQTAWPKLDFDGFQNELTDKLLIPMLEAAGPQLLQLNLNGATQLTILSFQACTKYNINLCKLFAQQIKWTNILLTPLPHLAQLDLSGSATLLSLGGEAPQLRSLLLNGCKKLKNLGDKLFSPLQLIELNIGNCEELAVIYFPIHSFLKIIAPQLSRMKSVKTIALQTDTGIQQVPSFLIESLINRLTRLNYSSSRVKLTAKQRKQLISYLAYDNTFTSLSLDEIDSDDAQALAAILQTNSTLTNVEIETHALNEEGQQLLAVINACVACNRMGKNSSFSEMALRRSNIRDAGVQILSGFLKKNVTIISADLANNKISAIGAQALAEVLKANTGLRRLDLSWNDLDDKSAQLLALALQANTTLNYLDLSHNAIGDAGAQALDQLHQTKPTLNIVYHESNKLSPAYLMRRRMQKDMTLDRLDFTDKQMDDASMSVLADELKTNTTIRNLYIGNNQIKDKGVQILAKMLKTNSTITHLDLRNNPFGDLGMQALANMLETNLTLIQIYLNGHRYGQVGKKFLIIINVRLARNRRTSTLDLHNQEMSPPGVQALVDEIKASATITDLNLENNAIGDEGATIIAELLKTDTTLSRINLKSTQMGDTGVRALAQVGRHNNSLVHLDLEDNKFSETGKQYLDIINADLVRNYIRKNPTLTTLKLSNHSNAGIRSLVELLKFTPMLTDLNFENNRMHAEGTQALAEVLLTNNTISKLRFSQNQFSDISMAILIASLQKQVTLTHLEIHYSVIGYEGAKALATLLKTNSRLTHLTLNGTAVGNGGEQVLAKALKTNTVLIDLDLRNNAIGSAGIQAFIEMLQTNTTLVSLNFDMDRPSEAKSLGMISVYLARNRMLQSGSTINTIDFDNKQIGSAGIQILAGALKSSTQVTTLKLSNNSLGLAGAQVLAAVLKVNKKITHIYAGNNQIGDAGALVFAQALESNNTVICVDLGDNQIGNDGARGLAQALKTNKTLTSLNLVKNQIDDRGAYELEQGIQSNEKLLYFSLYLNPISKRADYQAQEYIRRNRFLPALTQDSVADLSKMQLGDEGAETIAKLLKTNTTLTKLNLQSNQIGDAGFVALAMMLQSNSTLVNLDLSWNWPGTKGIKALAQALEVNTTLQRLDLQQRQNMDGYDGLDYQGMLALEEVEQALWRNPYYKKRAAPVSQSSQPPQAPAKLSDAKALIITAPKIPASPSPRASLQAPQVQFFPPTPAPAPTSDDPVVETTLPAGQMPPAVLPRTSLQAPQVQFLPPPPRDAKVQALPRLIMIALDQAYPPEKTEHTAVRKIWLDQLTEYQSSSNSLNQQEKNSALQQMLATLQGIITQRSTALSLTG